MELTKTKRLLALDVLRGLTVAGMLMVNYTGNGSYVYRPLVHAAWNGLTPADLVFPFFMFIMGISMYFSMSKFDEGLNGRTVWKILRRSLLMLAVGLGLAFALKWFKHADSVRLLGVVQRLAIAYCGAALIAQAMRHKHLLWVSAAILVAYGVALLVGNGYSLSADNIISVVDRAVIGEKFLYAQHLADGSSIPFDPEGLMSTLPCFAQVLLGCQVGKMIKERPDNGAKLNALFIFGTILLFAGLLLQYGLPINKRVWSPTYVLTTCGFASLLLALLIWIIDIKGHKRWTTFFEAFGVNPLFMYVVGSLLGMFCMFVPLGLGGENLTLRAFMFNDVWLPLVGNPYFASLLYSLCFVIVVWLLGYVLYRRRIYIKI